MNARMNRCFVAAIAAMWTVAAGAGTAKIGLYKAGKGAVAGGTVHAAGSKVTLTAKPAKGYVFAEWDFGSFPDADEALWRKRRQPKISFTMPDESFPIWATFIKASEDPSPVIATAASIWNVAEESEFKVVVKSSTGGTMSYPALKATGLPKGISLRKKFSGEYCHGADDEYILSRTGVTKPGVYTVKLAATNRSGKKATRTVKVLTPNVSTAVDIGALNLDTGSQYSISAGVKFSAADWQNLGIRTFDGWKLSAVTGVPGLKWNAAKQRLAGVPSKVGVYCATFTVTKGKKKKTATATFSVEALPESMVGTFTGCTMARRWLSGENEEQGGGEEYQANVFDGSCEKVTVTIASNGKVSAKVGTTSLSATGLSYAGGRYAATLRKSWKDMKARRQYTKTISFELDAGSGEMHGTLESYGAVFASMGAGAWFVAYDLNVRKGGSDIDAETLAAAAAAGKRGMSVVKASRGDSDADYELACPECSASPGKQTLFAKAEIDGKVTLSGKIAGKAVSGTSWLRRSGLEDGRPVAYFFSAGYAIKIVYRIDEDGNCVNVYGEAWR